MHKTNKVWINKYHIKNLISINFKFCQNFEHRGKSIFRGNSSKFCVKVFKNFYFCRLKKGGVSSVG